MKIFQGQGQGQDFFLKAKAKDIFFKANIKANTTTVTITS